MIRNKYTEKPWLSSYDKGVPSSLIYEDICLPDILERSAAQFPKNMALLFMGYKLNYKEFNDMVDRFATALQSFGIKEGDRVALVLPNVIPCVVAFYAILRIGAIAVMNNPLYTDNELLHQFNDSSSKAVIVLDLLANRIIDLREKTGITQIIVTSIGDYLPFPKNLLFPLVAQKKGLAAKVKKAPNVFQWKELIKNTTSNVIKWKNNFDDTALFQYTGGTTGISKGAVITHGNLSKQVQQLAGWFPAFNKGEEVILGALPFFHIFGLSTAMNLSIFMAWGDILVPKPQPEPLLEMIRKFKPTFAPLVPTMYIGMLNHEDIEKTDMTCLKGCFSGSAPLPVEVIKEFQKKTGSLIVEGYGLTESSPVTHINPFVPGRTKPGSIGIPLPDTVCRIVNIKNGKTDMPVGETGELIIQGPQVMPEYWNIKEETSKTLRNGWLHTGDIAKMDENGYFYIVDRLKDMIISGGLNVYPRDIDEIYYQHPKVKDACAVGIPHPTRGEQIKLFLVLKDGETATAEEMLNYSTGHLAKFKRPTEIEFMDDLPRSTVGKILRRELRDEEIKKRG